MSLLDDFADPILQELQRMDRATEKLRAQRNQYRMQLKQLIRAQRLLKLEYKALKAKHDDLIAGNYLRIYAWKDTEEKLLNRVLDQYDVGYKAGMEEAYRLVAMGFE